MSELLERGDSALCPKDIVMMHTCCMVFEVHVSTKDDG